MSSWFLDDQYGNGAFPHDPFCRAPEENVLETAQAMTRQDDSIDALLVILARNLRIGSDWQKGGAIKVDYTLRLQ